MSYVSSDEEATWQRIANCM